MSFFYMTKASVFALTEVVRPHIQKKDTKYRVAIPAVVRVACALFKLMHGVHYSVSSEMFAIGKSTVSKILREVVYAINIYLRHEISWSTIDNLHENEAKFYNLCSLPAVVGAIDGTHISLSKPCFSLADYYYFKRGGYTMNCQAVVDSEKRFMDLYIRMLGSTHNSRMLRKSTLYHLANGVTFWTIELGWMDSHLTC